MATSNSRPHPLQSQNPFSYILVMFIAFFLLLLNKVNSSDTLCFTFTKFVPNQEDLLVQGDALVSSSTGKLQLTKVENDKPISSSVGRVLHATPVHIWDSTTSRVASFHTSFSFVVKTPQAAKPADGIAFFFAPPDSQIQSSGGYLGLFSDKFYNGSNHIVAVEFDTYSNPWDPVSPHIGIDVNSIVSQKTVAWGWRNGEVANVVISYESATKTLTTCVTYPASQTSYILSAAVDLKSVLPEWVRVGFSATTGLSKYFVETHDVLSWSFSSTLQSTTGSNNNNCAKENNVLIAPYE